MWEMLLYYKLGKEITEKYESVLTTCDVFLKLISCTHLL